jgi:branched-chain amino acid aminotransferase
MPHSPVEWRPAHRASSNTLHCVANAILDGDLMDAAQATVSVTDEGFLRGDGVFEVMCLYGGKPFAFEDHMVRMQRSADNLLLPFDQDAVRADCEKLLGEAEGDGLLRVVVTRGGRRLGLLEPMPVYPPTLALASIEYAPTRVLDQVKSLSYAANMLSDRRAKNAGADLALLITPHGRILEGATSSFFAVLDGELVTAPISEHILESITRKYVIATSTVTERTISRDDIPNFSEAFLASTTREVHPVHKIDGFDLPAAPGPLTTAAAQAFSAHVAAAL